MNASSLYPEELSLREARRRYFEAFGLAEDGEYDARWVKQNVFGIVYRMPNPKARKVAVPYHDINHVLTEYPASVVGECMIGGYEVGSGIDRYWLGWIISSQAMVLGLALAPRRVLGAYARGRRSRSTYTLRLDDDLLDKTVGSVRRELGIASRPELKPTLLDIVTFAGHCTATVAGHLMPPLGVAYFLGRATLAAMTAKTTRRAK
jgi:hypothetical protein